MYEYFEHTADVGLRLRAPDLDGLFVDAARGLFALMVENLETVQPRRRVSFRLRGSDHEELLFDWIHELIVAFDTRHLLFSAFDVHVDSDGLDARAWGEPFDPEYHEAMSMLENPDAEPGSVLEVVQKGYILNDRLVRPARVLVAKDMSEPKKTP